MSIPRNILDSESSIDNWSILLGYRGSISHGTYVPNKDPNSIDDKDAIGICIPPMDYYYGLKTFGSRGTMEIKRGEWSLEKVKAEAERLFIAAETAYTLSKLPVKPDHEKINELCVTVARYFERNRNI